MADQRRMTFIVVPHRGGDSSTRSFEVSYRRVKVGAVLLLAAVVIWVGAVGSWWYLAAQAARVPGLKRQVVQMEEDRERVTQLAEALRLLEGRYAQVRSMLGADGSRGDESLWLPAVGDGATDPEESGEEPSSWPLLERGFVTQDHLGELGDRHEGIDIAVPVGSYIRAAGAGRVVEAREDSVYGRFIRIHHANGYETLYAHASELLVDSGATVQRNEVIALSGNTGRSTAPHLHFEVRRNGTPIDPRRVVTPPN